MNRRRLAHRVAALATALALLPAARARAAQAQASQAHRIILHIDENNEATMNEALNNLENVVEYYAGRHEPLAVELVANGSGYAILRSTSPVRARIADIHQRLPDIVFSACQNSRAGAAQREGKRIEQITELPEATDVPAGIARIVDLQELGWSYYKV